MTRPMPSADRVRALAQTAVARCRTLAAFTEEPGRTTRTFLSPPMRQCHDALTEWTAPLCADVRIDAAGNFRALYPSAAPEAPTLILGSHLDTVPDAGAFDGVLGVILGVILLEALHGERLPFAIEVVGFSEEEGVRFGMPFLGSRALVGSLDGVVLAREDQKGISVRAAIENFGLHPNDLPQARLHGSVLGYIEFHIEQGPLLEALGLPLAVVDAVAGQSRLEIVFTGQANHAGTTPMHLRHDALAGASEWISAVEREARCVPDLVATVGSANARPGAVNVIAGEVTVTLDVRHRDDDLRTNAVDVLVRSAEEIAAQRGLTMRMTTLLNQPAVDMDSTLVSHAGEAVRRAGCQLHRMASGAGHDAMILAEHYPATMIFLRTPRGLSHSPKEAVLVEDVEKAIEAGLHLLDVLASIPAREPRRIDSA